MSELYISNVGVRNYEHITSSSHGKQNKGIFIVAKNIENQKELCEMLLNKGVKANEIFLIGKDSFITLTPEDKTDIKIVITTLTHSMGYTLTKISVMITSVYFSSQSTRTQLECRINRIGQKSEEINIITIHCGILSYIHKNYENARSLEDAIKQFAKNI